MKTGCIYKITNTVNGKCYIGQTTYFANRIRKYFNCTTMQGCVYDAIAKYGKESFTVQIIEDGIPDNMLDEREVYYIGLYNTTPPNGYNLTEGGRGKRGSGVIETKKRRHTEESKRKMSEAKKGIKRPDIAERNRQRKGYKHTEQTKKKIGKSVKRTRRKNKRMKTEYRHSDETKRKMRESHLKNRRNQQ